jgi:hypothetical protein
VGEAQRTPHVDGKQLKREKEGQGRIKRKKEGKGGKRREKEGNPSPGH